MERNLKESEALFIRGMLKSEEDRNRYVPFLSNCLVKEMMDGGMGGLEFLSSRPDRILGRELAAIEFQDEDGVTVIATINLDQYGDLFELDIWKTDFSPLKNLPIN